MLNESLESRTSVSQQVWEGRAGLPGRKELVRLKLICQPLFFTFSQFSSEGNYLLVLFCLAQLVRRSVHLRMALAPVFGLQCIVIKHLTHYCFPNLRQLTVVFGKLCSVDDTGTRVFFYRMFSKYLCRHFPIDNRITMLNKEEHKRPGHF